MNFRRPRGNVSTRLVVGIDPSTDAGRAKAFRYGADECLTGAEKLHDGFPDLTGEYILTFHALELALKAFLANRGLSNAELARKPFGHDLLKLYAEAQAHGLKVSVHKAAELIEWVNQYHDQGALLRNPGATAGACHAQELVAV